jgi:hypothetical protein
MTGDARVPTLRAMTNRALLPTGRTAASCVAGFLGGFLVLNTYWALGGTWGVAWVIGCAGCTVPLALVWVQEALVVAGMAVMLARAGRWRFPLPDRALRFGVWMMAVAFGAVGAQNLLGDNTSQARFLFAPLAVGLCVLSARATRDVAEDQIGMRP